MEKRVRCTYIAYTVMRQHPAPLSTAQAFLVDRIPSKAKKKKQRKKELRSQRNTFILAYLSFTWNLFLLSVKVRWKIQITQNWKHRQHGWLFYSCNNIITQWGMWSLPLGRPLLCITTKLLLEGLSTNYLENLILYCTFGLFILDLRLIKSENSSQQVAQCHSIRSLWLLV